MKFFDRAEEIARLREIRAQVSELARFTVVTGRRRVGKTQLIKRALEDRPYLYFYVARKTEKDLCAGFVRQVRDVLGAPIIGQVDRFEDLFRALVEMSKREPLTIVIDEFQDFYRVNPTYTGEMQWLGGIVGECPWLQIVRYHQSFTRGNVFCPVACCMDMMSAEKPSTVKEFSNG